MAKNNDKNIWLLLAVPLLGLLALVLAMFKKPAVKPRGTIVVHDSISEGYGTKKQPVSTEKIMSAAAQAVSLGSSIAALFKKPSSGQVAVLTPTKAPTLTGSLSGGSSLGKIDFGALNFKTIF